MPRKIDIFDTTLRDGEQAPGANLALPEKLLIAQQLARLGVDIIEAGFPFSSPDDFEAVGRIAAEVKGATIAGLSRAMEPDIASCWEAVQHAQRPRIHTFIATSDIHVERKFRKTRDEVLEMAVNAVKYARSLCQDVEFSTEDAGRTDKGYLAAVVEAVIEAGANVVNIPDTVGYTAPWEFASIIRHVFEHVPNIEQTKLSVHCHDDLGMSVANSLAAVKEGVGQVECCINGVGERAGNASLEEVVMAIETRNDLFDCATNVNTGEIMRTSRMVSNLMGFPVPPNKAVVGANAFRHQAGIHVDGVLKDRTTYEIMTPESVGVSESKIVLGPTSGRKALAQRLSDLGYTLNEDQLERAYERFLSIADRRKEVSDQDLEAIVRDTAFRVIPEVYALEQAVTSQTELGSTAAVVLRTKQGTLEGTGKGDGPVDAIYQAINSMTELDLELVDFNIRAIGSGSDAIGEATVRIRWDGHTATGLGSSLDVVKASARAYVDAINRLLFQTGREEGREGRG
ncbi:MAG: 2-isopropylmalate synthase [Armatimonadota bacterium]